MFKNLVLSVAFIFVAATLACAAESIRFNEATKTVMSVSVDSVLTKVTWYVDNYVTNPNRPQDQKINIYIPDGATKASPIIFLVNNSGWLNDNYPENTLQQSVNYDGSNDKIGFALKNKYVIVSYGARSRANGATQGKFLGHSPATMTDTKAAIRYLRFNRKVLPAGNTDRIIITGTSGGGALSTLIAASGNSPDFYESLYEIGAAGIEKRRDGSLHSIPGCGDEVFAVIAYCPITDLGHADAAYEWLFHDTRKALYHAGKAGYPFADQETIMSASAELAGMYGGYIDSLGLKDGDGRLLTCANFKEFIVSLMRSEIEKTISEKGPQAMLSDIEGRNDWLSFDAQGAYTYDFDKHLYYLAENIPLKPAPAFSNKSLLGAPINEDTLFGSETQKLCPFNEYSWNHDAKDNGVGLDDTGLDWKSFLETQAGKTLSLQIKMTNAVDYLVEGKSDTAPFWYVRHGMVDRDTSWAVEAMLFAAIMNNSRVHGHDVGFSWLMPHDGDYDVPEAFAWLKRLIL